MICRDCRTGGDMVGQQLFAAAESAHKKCRGKSWCDCQHRVNGSVSYLGKKRRKAHHGTKAGGSPFDTVRQSFL